MVIRFLANILVALLALLSTNQPFGSPGIDEVTYAENLGFHLLGTITGKNATILVKILASNQIMAVKQSQTFLGHYVIEKIEDKSLVLTSLEGKRLLVYSDAFAADGVATAVTVEPEKPAIYSDNFKEEGFDREGNQIKVSRDYMNKIIRDDLPKVLMQAGAEPVEKDGAIVGFRFFEIDKDSIYAKAGLQDGDIISSINGRPLDNVGETVKLLQSLKNANDLKIDVERGGQKTTVSLDVQ